jgi:hypothetical protein
VDAAMGFFDLLGLSKLPDPTRKAGQQEGNNEPYLVLTPDILLAQMWHHQSPWVWKIAKEQI